MIFAFLIAVEIAGFRVHHTVSVEFIHYNHSEQISARDSGDDSPIPCQNDETPIEHVIHHSTGNMSSGNVFFVFPIFITSPTSEPFPLVPVITYAPYALKDQVYKSMLAFEASPYRAPPVTL